jgi:hypothetical protein
MPSPYPATAKSNRAACSRLASATRITSRGYGDGVDGALSGIQS